MIWCVSRMLVGWHRGGAAVLVAAAVIILLRQYLDRPKSTVLKQRAGSQRADAWAAGSCSTKHVAAHAPDL
jgi:hypothetical protein